MSAAKDDVRRAMRARRRAVTADARAERSRRVCAALAARVKDLPRPVVAVYLAGPDELDLTAFIRQLWDRAARVLAPRWNGATYELAPYTPTTPLVAGPHGIPEPAAEGEASSPSDVDVWIVPGLAFTRDGKRLGYGGGWYDRFLSAASPASLKLGVAYPFQILPALPCEPHDLPLTAVVTG